MFDKEKKAKRERGKKFSLVQRKVKRNNKRKQDELIPPGERKIIRKKKKRNKNRDTMERRK